MASPPTDPPDDDRDAREADAEDEHVCDVQREHIAESFACIPCIPCYLRTGETVCQFTCEHRKDLE